MIRANPSGAVYGLITIGALLAAESAGNETYLETVLAVVLGLLAIWMAQSYANLIAWRTREQSALNPRALARSLRYELAILAGGALPVLVVLICWIAGVSLNVGVNVGVITTAVTIVGVEAATGVSSGLSGRQLLVQTLLGAVLGVMILGLRVILH